MVGEQIDALLVLSCDKYIDTHYHFECTLNEFWPDIEFPIYFLTESQKNNQSNLNYVHTGIENTSWGYMVRRGLGILGLENAVVLFTFDDLFLNKPVKTREVEKVMSIANNIGYQSLKLTKKLLGNRIDNRLFLIPDNYIYKNTLVWTIWKTPQLLQKLRDSMSPWDFEKSDLKTPSEGNSLIVSQSVISYINTVVKGSKTIEYRTVEKKYGINTKRPELSQWAMFKRFIRIKAFNTYKLIFYVKHILRAR